MEGLPDSTIELAVLEILQDANLENMTEFKVRKLAAEKLGTDLNAPAHKKLVRKVVEDFLSSRAESDEKEAANDETAAGGQEEVAEQETDAGADAQSSRFASKKQTVRKDRGQYGGDDANQFVCQLSNKRNVSIQKFKGNTLISIREYYEKDGELLPSSKGISLSVDQWKIFKSHVPAIESAISRLQ